MRKLYALIFLFVFWSCRNELPYENVKFYEKPVIHALFQTDSGVQTTAFKSLPVTGKTDVAEIGNVNLKLYNASNSFLIGMNKVEPGKFSVDYPLKTDSVYVLKLNSDMGNDIFTVKIQPVTKINKVDTFTSANYNSSTYFNMYFHMSNDPSRILFYRYYVLEGYFKYAFNGGANPSDSVFIQDQLEINSNEKIFLSNLDNTYSNREILFTNQGLSAGNIVLKTGSSNLKRKNKEIRMLWIMPVLETVDENLYKFYNDRNAHIYHQNDLVSQPGTVFTNIKGGYGIYGSFSKSTFKIKF